MGCVVSDAWHFTRLRFEGWAGVAKLHGVRVPLTRMPELPGLVVAYVAIDYIPEVGMRRIMPLGGPWRDMRDDEVAAADALLRDLVGA